MTWKKEDEQFLIENYINGPKYCAEKLNRTIASVKNKAKRLSLTKDITYWSDKEIKFLVGNYTDKGLSYCAEKLNRTYKAVQAKAGELSLRKSRLYWSRQEIKFLIENYANYGPTYCSEKLGRTYPSVQLKASKLGLQANTKYSSNIIYAVYFPELFLYKIGITNCIERRSREFGQNCVILKTQECETSQEAAELERLLLKSVMLINTGALNCGNTETFTELSETIKEFLGKQFAD